MTSNDQNDSFASLLEESFKGPRHFEPGQKVTAVVASLGKEWVFLDLGSKSEGCLARREVTDGEGNLTVKVGDTVSVYFQGAEKNAMLFTLSLGGGTDLRHLEEAKQSGIPVEGLVAKEVKGGFEVTLGGVTRAFCPYSQMDVRRIEQGEDYIGQRLLFRVTEFGEKGRNIVLSRRQLLEEERQARKEELLNTLKVGDLVDGTITSVRDFGAFVDIGGIEGLIPISEIGWGRVEDIHGHVEAGQQVKVAVLKLDWENDRYSFSLKETQPDPWQEVPNRFPEGSCHTGTVARLTTFGAFVTLSPGIDGLVHISQLGGGRRINHPREVVSVGQEIEVRVEGIDVEEKRISLALAVAAKESESEEQAEEQAYKQYVAKAKKQPAGGSMGTLGDLLQKKLKQKK